MTDSSEPGTGSSTADEILQLTQDALHLAAVACHFDRDENYAGAYDYYDKCILNIDEVMSKLPPTSVQWRKLHQIRTQYDERMDLLKEIESSRNSFFKSSSNTELAKLPLGGGGSGSRFGLGRSKKLAADDLVFTEIDINHSFDYEAPPASITAVPYWILRNIKRSIVSGGYLSETCFVPRAVWSQPDVKFSGLAAKTTAFELVIRLMASLESLPALVADDSSLTALETALQTVVDELNSLQNQLAKPFPYIKEIDNNDGLASTEHSSHASDDGMGTPTTKAASASPLQGSNSGQSASSASASPIPPPPPTSTTPSSSLSKGSISSFMSSLSRHVRKYAEVGFHRLAVALPSKLSAEEMADYTQLITRLCDKSQILAQLFQKLMELRTTRLTVMQRGSEGTEMETETLIVLQMKADNSLQSLMSISSVMRDVVCEILLRDVEYLVEKYVARTRKAFSRMYWDQEQGTDSSS